ncbi:MAG: hypothetical protein ACTIC1_20555 [Brevibacterium sp.]|uniref:hypothetical protein n=1 Tax=Brevibacterium aurantiacum TaxID=273384 RepID=UPI001055DE66|nr:hypothetical protein [Brevibacterium aurantiacum]
MTVTEPLTIAIASAAYRAHYVNWFKDALASQGIRGEVIALEYRSFIGADVGSSRLQRNPARLQLTGVSRRSAGVGPKRVS